MIAASLHVFKALHDCLDWLETRSHVKSFLLGVSAAVAALDGPHTVPPHLVYFQEKSKVTGLWVPLISPLYSESSLELLLYPLCLVLRLLPHSRIMVYTIVVHLEALPVCPYCRYNNPV